MFDSIKLAREEAQARPAAQPWLPWLSAVAVTTLLGLVACSSSDEVTPAADAGTETPDGGVVAEDGGAKETPDAARPGPVFLDPSTYADLVTIDASFPFGVTQRHRADAAIVGSRWGRHGGPMVTTGVYGDGATPAVVHWTIPGDAPTDPATRKEQPFAAASDLPATFFYGPDGMVDLPFGPFALLSYTGSGAAFPGEALLYDAAYGAVKSRAKVNGFYSGVGLADGARQLVVYSGLSPLAAADSTTNDNGLYAADVCDGALVASAPCPAPRKLFGWSGASGPVATDAHGNAFVGASLSGGATSDAVYGLPKAKLLAEGSADGVKLAEVDSGGTASLAAVAPAAGAEGWVLGLGFDPKAAVYAAPYVEQSGALGKGAAVVAAAITRANDVEGLSVFTDPEGDLWLAVTTATEGFYLELRPRTP